MYLLGFSLRQDLHVQVGLKGEVMNLVSPNAISSAEWVGGSLAAKKQQPLTWYKVMLSTKASCVEGKAIKDGWLTGQLNT